MSGRAPRRRLLRKLGLSLATLGALAVALEVGARVVLRLRGSPWDGAEARAAIAEMRSRVADVLPLPGEVSGVRRDEESPVEVIHPYVGYDIADSRSQVANGLRASRKPDAQTFRLLVFGGSVAAIFERLGAARLLERLAADPRLEGRRPEIWGLARGAYKQPQQYLYLSYLLSLGIRPDAVLNIDGFNEVALGASNRAQGMHPTWPSYDQWMPLVFTPTSRDELIDRYVAMRTRRDALERAASSALRLPVFWSAGLGALAHRWCRSREVAYTHESQAYMDALSRVPLQPALLGPRFEGGLEVAVLTSIECWFQSSLLIDHLCDDLRIPYLHVLQPTLHDPGAKPLSPDEQRKGKTRAEWLAGVQQGYPLLRKGGERLRERGVAFLDASRVFAEVEETLYYDECHFEAAGNERLADAIAPALLEELSRAR